MKDEQGIVFTPWVWNGMSGFSLTLPDGSIRYLYLNPSDSDSAGVSNVFLYLGPHGDPDKDKALHFYTLEDD